MSRQSKQENKRISQQWQRPTRSINAKLPDGKEINFQTKEKGVSETVPRHHKVNRWPYNAKKRAQIMRTNSGMHRGKTYVG